MDIILGAWGLGADLGIPSRYFEGMGRNLGLPPMSSRHPGCVELFPFLMFDRVLIDERSYKALLNEGILGFVLSPTGKDLLSELHREEILYPINFVDVLREDVDRLTTEAQRLLETQNLDQLLQKARILWSEFLTSPGGSFHPLKDEELAGTIEEIQLLRSGLNQEQVQSRCLHDVFDVVATLVLSEKLEAAICDWQMYRPFYDQKLMTSLAQMKRATPPDAEQLHENLDIYIPLPATANPESVFSVRESRVFDSFRRYVEFLDKTKPNYSPKEFMEFRTSLLSLEEGPVSRVNVFPSVAQCRPAFSEDYLRRVVRSELAAYFTKLEKNTSGITNIFQMIGGTLTMGDTYTAGQAGAMGPNSKAENISFQQIRVQTAEECDLAKLAEELNRLQAEMRNRSQTPEHDISIGEVASAEKAAIEGDGPVMLRHLAKAGKWALENAREIGVNVATEVIKKALGLS